LKVAVIKLGSRISFNANDTSGANGEARSICKMLKLGGAEVHIYTKILKKDNLIEDYHWHSLNTVEASKVSDIEERIFVDKYSSTYIEHRKIQLVGDLSNMDALVVLNGTVQFYGGEEDPEQLLNYFIINNFKGKVFYIYCDPELTLKQVWPSVSKKPWASNWSQSDLEITRTDIVYLSQPHNVNHILDDLKKNEVIPREIIHYPFEQFPCLNEQLPFNPSPEVDLSYGGTMRGGKREKKMARFYFGHTSELSVEMFGKIKEEDFNPKNIFGLTTPTFSGPVKYDDMLPKMNKSMAHCVIGDPYYEKIEDMAQRCYESIWSNVVTFIDSDMDKLRRVYGKDRVLSDFLYVTDRQELAEKILLLKEDNDLRKQILQDQLKAVNFNPEKYCTDFVNLIKLFASLKYD